VIRIAQSALPSFLVALAALFATPSVIAGDHAKAAATIARGIRITAPGMDAPAESPRASRIIVRPCDREGSAPCRIRVVDLE
jgi:hypothetical protein